jgi:hypothetical protein
MERWSAEQSRKSRKRRRNSRYSTTYTTSWGITDEPAWQGAIAARAWRCATS